MSGDASIAAWLMGRSGEWSSVAALALWGLIQWVGVILLSCAYWALCIWIFVMMCDFVVEFVQWLLGVRLVC